MNAPLTPIDFAPAYRQLQPMERTFVDGYVADIEAQSEQTGERLLTVLQRQSTRDLDERTFNMLSRPMVRAAIADRVRELSMTMELSVYRTLKELKSLAYSNIGDYMIVNQYTGMPEFTLATCTPEQLAAVASIEIEEQPKTGARKFKFKLHDKLGALREVLQYQGLRNPDNPHWKAVVDTQKSAAQLPATITEDGAADAYARQING